MFLKGSASSSHVITLSEEHVQFLTGPVSITAASRDNRHIPSLCRALACRVAADGGPVSLLLYEPHARQLLRDVQQSGRLAAVFSDPPSHRTLQIKGVQPKVEALQLGDLELVARSCEAFAQAIIPLGFRHDFAHALHSYEAEGLLALSFLPTAIYEQSPGPSAGNRIDSNSSDTSSPDKSSEVESPDTGATDTSAG